MHLLSPGSRGLFVRSTEDKPIDDPSLGDLSDQVSTDINFRCPMVAVALARIAAGQPVWQYQFDYTPPDGTKVRHASEIPYVMAGVDELGAAAPPLQAYWINSPRPVIRTARVCRAGRVTMPGAAAISALPTPGRS